MTVTTPIELSHVERENAAYNAAMSASARRSPEAFRLWKRYAQIHSERSAEVVAQRCKNLT